MAALRPHNPGRSLAALLFLRLGQFVFITTYVLGIYQAYQANGFWKALVVAIPIIGILILAGSSIIPSDSIILSFYLLFSAAALYIIGNVLWPKPQRH